MSRAAATGGGRTYRGQVPVNWYAALVLIVVLGVASVIFARYEYQHPSSASTTAPTVGTTWYAGYALNLCGTVAPPLSSNADSSGAKQSFFTTGNGVITISPQKAAVAGDNATLGQFVAAYHGLELSANKLTVPITKTTTRTYTNGQSCPAGTPDAGKAGTVVVDYWPSAFATETRATTVQGDPGDLKFSQNQLISIGFVPAGTKLAKPSGSVVTALIQASTAASTTTTTTPTATTTPTTTPTTTTTTTTPTTTTRASS